ncbi:TetR/AcrR family transcriptional regulator [Neisseria sp. Ec49-e6-T10]|uniref:TetR/AcrR family transcriptional regulator n=1 Tax=Neisseria sp. Ec49-e6-T10 TaxID=3140744 RepID=UPI003EBCFF0C
MKIQKTIRSDGAVTKELILEVAGRLFAEKGFNGTTSKEICTLAHANQAAVNYHFGGKIELYQAVLIQAHSNLLSIDFLLRIQNQTISAEKKLDLIIEQLTANVLNNEWHIKIFIREIFSPTPHFEQAMSQVVNKEVLPKMNIVKQIIGDRINLPADNPTVSRCLFSIGAPFIVMLVARKDILNGIFKGVAPKQSCEELATYFKLFVQGGLEQVSNKITDSIE